MGLLDIIFPKNCLECGAQGQYICEKCIKKVRRFSLKVSPERLGELDDFYAIWKYEGVVRGAIHALKYRFASDLAKELSDIAVSLVAKSYIGLNSPILVPIPLYNKRQNWRGYNQSKVIGERLSTGLGWRIENNLLTAPLASKQQVGLSKMGRMRNKRGKYAINEDNELPKDSKVILFDDVWTTGATMREATKVLKDAGFRQVYGLTLCA